MGGEKEGEGGGTEAQELDEDRESSELQGRRKRLRATSTVEGGTIWRPLRGYRAAQIGHRPNGRLRYQVMLRGQG